MIPGQGNYSHLLPEEAYLMSRTYSMHRRDGKYKISAEGIGQLQKSL
jgi:hypothetical protein